MGLSAKDLFRRDTAVLEYRPTRTRKGVAWYWALVRLPQEDRAIETGHAETKAMASLAARKAAARKQITIEAVRTINLEVTYPNSQTAEPLGPR